MPFARDVRMGCGNMPVCITTRLAVNAGPLWVATIRLVIVLVRFGRTRAVAARLTLLPYFGVLHHWQAVQAHT